MKPAVEWPTNTHLPAATRDLVETMTVSKLECRICGDPLGVDGAAAAHVTTLEATGWVQIALTHSGCAGPSATAADKPDDSATQFRIACVALPDGRAALVVNPDANRFTVDDSGAPVASQPLADIGWAPAAPESEPAQVPGWARLDGSSLELAYSLGVMNIEVPTEWANLARTGPGDDLPVIVMLTQPVDRWEEATSWDDILQVLRHPHTYAGLLPLR